MRWWHRHRWGIIAITATVPMRTMEVSSIAGAPTIREVLQMQGGCTTFVLRCEDAACHAVTMREAAGALTRLDPTFATLLEIPR
jgi:hypothetical protein